ncbi:MAG: hypothetical protein AAGN46_11710 [Acidobacteriota bacterium]
MLLAAAWLAGVSVPALPVGADSSVASVTEERDALGALAAGNDLVEAGELERAIEVYRSGWSPRRQHPTLAYNLGTTLHLSDRLPEAILWYRRADADDPWVEENLWLARRSLGSRRIATGGPWAPVAAQAGTLSNVGIGLAWLALLGLAFERRLPRATWLALALGAILTFGAARALERWGPRPAVLLATCRSPAGDLPAGTEVEARWDGTWRVAGETFECPDQAVEPIDPAL